MKEVIGLICLLVFLIMYSCLNQWIGRREGYKRGQIDGFDSGYELGHKDADSWWISSESATEKVRREMWERRMK